MAQYWLLKSEPDTYSFDDLLKDGKTSWDGVRNYQARNFISEMAPGDLALFYHSVSEKSVVGIMKVATKAYPDIDPNRNGSWVKIDVTPVEKLRSPVNLKSIKADPKLQEIALIRHSRLSVMPLKKIEFDRIISMGKSDQ